MFSMHTAHLANVSKSVTKNATFSRTGGLPFLITWQLHVCYISKLLGDSFSVSQQPPSGIPVPNIPWMLHIKLQFQWTDFIILFINLIVHDTFHNCIHMIFLESSAVSSLRQRQRNIQSRRLINCLTWSPSCQTGLSSPRQLQTPATAASTPAGYVLKFGSEIVL